MVPLTEYAGAFGAVYAFGYDIGNDGVHDIDVGRWGPRQSIQLQSPPK
jgi:hypothetical protein